MDTDENGTPYGRYRLIELIGRGGMGEVWRAFDTSIGRVVALKLLRTHLVDDPSFERRFRREAQAAAGLNNPHVVPVHDFGEIEGRFYVSMQLIEGSDLQQLLVRGPLEPARAVNIIEQIASALHAAHRIGLVHRDVKPSNILISEDDFAYLIDFGIARSTGQTGLTSTGTTIGTWAYMAPERFKAGIADARADIYALACVLYQCLTARLPFPDDDREQIAAAHMFLPPPEPSAFQTRLTEQMDRVTAIGMAKEPDDRFATTKDLAAAARAALATDTPAPSTAEFADTIKAAAASRPANADPRSKSQRTQQFSQRWPNPEGTGYTPYPDHLEQSQGLRLKRSFGAGQLALALGGAAVLTAGLVVALWLSLSGRQTESHVTANNAPTAQQALSTTFETSRPAISSLPGTDNLGFVDYPRARCDPGSKPAVIARTTLSVLVVCQVSPGSYYYRAVRVSDGASIELANAVRSSEGFDVTDPADGSLRQVRPTYVRIVFAGGPVQTEPVTEYASQ